MKIKITLLILSILVLSINSFSGEIPEAEKLHPELYTLQFTYVEFPDSSYMKASEEQHKLMDRLADSSKEKRVEIRALLRQMDIEKIRSWDDVIFSNLATIYLASGESIPDTYSEKVMLDIKSKILQVSGIKCHVSDHSIHKIDLNEFVANEWFPTIAHVGGKCGYLLVKCYPPTNE